MIHKFIIDSYTKPYCLNVPVEVIAFGCILLGGWAFNKLDISMKER
jgi:hypothetical protein